MEENQKQQSGKEEKKQDKNQIKIKRKGCGRFSGQPFT